MPTPTDERRDLLTVIAYMRARPGKEHELRQALDAHLDTPHLRHFAAIMGDLLDDGGLTITRLRRIA